jgi:hypothetical protein
MLSDVTWLSIPNFTHIGQKILKIRVKKYIFAFTYVGRGSSVGIATDNGMDGPGIESRWEARFCAPVQTGPGAHPASYTMGTGSLPE